MIPGSPQIAYATLKAAGLGPTWIRAAKGAPRHLGGKQTPAGIPPAGQPGGDTDE